MPMAKQARQIWTEKLGPAHSLPVMVKAVVHQAQGSEDRSPAEPRALLSWFQSRRKELGRCHRFEELNK